MYSPQLPLALRVLSPSEMDRSNTEPGGLEASLLQLVHNHHHTSLRLREHTATKRRVNEIPSTIIHIGALYEVFNFKSEKAKKDAIRNAVRVSDLLVDAVNGGVQESFINEKRIELEIRALAATIMRFTKQTDQWLSASRAINSAIKEIGDFENWMRTMDFDCKSINAAIRNIHEA